MHVLPTFIFFCLYERIHSYIIQYSNTYFFWHKLVKHDFEVISGYFQPNLRRMHLINYVWFFVYFSKLTIIGQAYTKLETIELISFPASTLLYVPPVINQSQSANAKAKMIHTRMRASHTGMNTQHCFNACHTVLKFNLITSRISVWSIKFYLLYFFF